MVFLDRRDAGRKLAKSLVAYRDRDTIVLGMPRGGVVVAYEVALELDVPLDVIVARKLGAPWNPEFGIGAIAPGNITILDRESTGMLGISESQLGQLIDREKTEMEHRLRKFRGDRPFPDLEAKTVILVDDGLATGVTARAALASVSKRKPDEVVLAIPVCAPDSLKRIRREAHRIICLHSPEDFRAVGNYYQDFSQTSDEEVIALLKSAENRWSTSKS